VKINLRRRAMKLNVWPLAFTIAVLWAVAVLFVGVANIIRPAYGTIFLQLVASIYPGYHATGSLRDLIVGTAYAFLDGFFGGLVFAWLYNRFARKR
jgi:ABC-type nitrate/sulfonate/bicarbonate transport system permease component